MGGVRLSKNPRGDTNRRLKPTQAILTKTIHKTRRQAGGPIATDPIPDQSSSTDSNACRLFLQFHSNFFQAGTNDSTSHARQTLAPILPGSYTGSPGQYRISSLPTSNHRLPLTNSRLIYAIACSFTSTPSSSSSFPHCVSSSPTTFSLTRPTLQRQPACTFLIPTCHHSSSDERVFILELGLHRTVPTSHVSQLASFPAPPSSHKLQFTDPLHSNLPIPITQLLERYRTHMNIVNTVNTQLHRALDALDALGRHPPRAYLLDSALDPANRLTQCSRQPALCNPAST